MMRHIYFVVYDGCEILDIAGPAQVFHEANECGAHYVLHYCATKPTVRSSQGLEFSSLEPLPELSPEDWVFIPGFDMSRANPANELARWLHTAAEVGVRLCTICTGIFVLGAVGLADGRACTTHWHRINDLRTRFPRAKVQDNRLYVDDGNLISSAGIASGIDMTIYLLGQDVGLEIASSVARAMVIYLRRDGHQAQISTYLEFQDHLNSSVHIVQDYLINHPDSNETIAELAELAHVSPRHLTRLFRQVTGISINEFRARLRLEYAAKLIHIPELSIEMIAAQCGFNDARHFRRLWKKHYGYSPSQHANHLTS